MRARLRLLVLGDSGTPTGFSRVVTSILSRLPQDEYECHVLARTYLGDPHDLPWKLYPACVGDGDPYGTKRLRWLIERVEPDLVFSLGDPWVQAKYLEELRPHSNRLPILTYTAIDGAHPDPEWFRDAGSSRVFAVYTQWAKQEVLRCLGSDPSPQIEVVPHGVDRDEFHPIVAGDLTNSRAEAKSLLGFPPDSFIVLNANMNQSRKRIDVSIHAFAEFAKRKPPNVKLFLHMSPKGEGWDVAKLAQRCGLNERLILSFPGESGTPELSTDQLNLIYNACDIGLNTSCGEGWGLSSFEHAATGASQIVPGHFSCLELWGESGVIVHPRLNLVDPGSLYEFRVVDALDVAEAIERLYVNHEYRNVTARRCYEHATSNEFDWERIARRWHELFQSAVSA